MNATLDDSFDLVIASASHPDRSSLRALPRRIGISRRELGGWDDYAKLEPMRSLPLFARELCPSATDETVDRFVLAHRAGGFVGLTIDRIADRQTPNDAALALATRTLVRCWVDRLADATNEPRHVVAESVRSVLQSHAHGLRGERRARRSRLANARAYASFVASKTDWLALATRWMLVREGASSSISRFQSCFESLLLGLQLADDALDDEEDRAIRGVSVADELEVPRTSMLIAAERLLVEAEVRAHVEGLDRLSAFCAAYVLGLHAAIPSEGPISAIGAAFLLADMARAGPPGSRESVREIVPTWEPNDFDGSGKPTRSVSVSRSLSWS